jgi:hypothetical protein
VNPNQNGAKECRAETPRLTLMWQDCSRAEAQRRREVKAFEDFLLSTSKFIRIRLRTLGISRVSQFFFSASLRLCARIQLRKLPIDHSALST